jgi:hypothetical protein
MGCGANDYEYPAPEDYTVEDAYLAPEGDRAEAEVLLNGNKDIREGWPYLRDIQVRCSTEGDPGTNTEFSSFTAQTLWHGVTKACVDGMIRPDDLAVLGDEVLEAYTERLA